MTETGETQRWNARPVQAGLIRTFVLVAPLAASILFVHLASKLVAVPTGSFLLFISWWVLLSGAATVVLVAVDRVCRRLLPLAALFKLSLVFPDQVPSRFRMAMRSSTVETLQKRVAEAKAGNLGGTPVEAAERLLALVASLDSHDRLTRGHADRVRAYAQMIAKELRLGKDQLDLLNWAALLHDIGKLGVPTEILKKPGRPTEQEWQLLRRHPELGENLVAPLRSWLGEWADAVGDHHERWDGGGYPRGKASDDISLAGRIVAVADVFDVITSARSYKSASAATKARDEIARCAGGQLDPRVVRAFLSVSLGRLRFAMGPLSWLAHTPILGRIPLTSAIGSASSSVAAVAAAVTTGLVGAPPPTLSASPPRPPAPPVQETSFAAPTVARAIDEDTSIFLRLDGITGSESLTSLRILAPPSAGRAVATSSGAIRYTPPSDFNGAVALRYEACRSGDECSTAVVRIAVRPVNDPPNAVDDTARTTAGEPVTIYVLANDTDPDDDMLFVTSVSGVTAGEATIGAARVVWTPPPGFSGKASFRYAVDDGNDGIAVAHVSVSVAAPDETPAAAPDESAPAETTPPEDVPAAAAVANQAPSAADDTASVAEDGSVTIDVLTNDHDPDGAALSVQSVGPPSKGSAALVGDGARFTPPPDFSGSASFEYVVVDGGGATDTGSVSVTVTAVNDAPSFTAGRDQSVFEDAGPQTVSAGATGISPGPADESSQSVSFLVSAGNAALFTAGGQPAMAAGGTLTFTPAANATGTAEVTLRARDDGGGANGGIDTSPPQTLTITVVGVNDAPSFTAGPDQWVPEDAGPQTVSAWATGISPGPPDESSQSISFLVSTDNASLFTAGGQPAVGADGSLTYTPVANANGTAAVTVRARDDGGSANGGSDTSPPQTLTITVGGIDDAPSFTAGPDQWVLEDAGPQTVSAWATGISPGPPDESSQSVSFLVSTTNPALFAAGGQPAVAADGTLTYTPALNASGTSAVTVRAMDGGGTSAPHTLTITVSAVEDPPTAGADSPTTAEDDSAGVTFDVLANDTDVDPGDVLSLGSYDGSSIANGTLTDNGGGSFTYVPDPAFFGSETFSYTVADSDGATDAGTVTITVAAQPDPPTAADDAYLTPQDTVLVRAAPGVLANDGDEDGDVLTVQTTPVTGPWNGALALAADGSFTYTPTSGFAGTDTFTYRIDDGTGFTDDGVVTITVDSAAVPSTLYLAATGPSADVWDLTTAPPAAAFPVPDVDGDGFPGLTIDKSDGEENTDDSEEFQLWAYVPVQPLVLNGPVTLQLWSTIADFEPDKDGHPHVYLYDCAAGGASCVKIAENDVHVKRWDNLVPDWVYREITIGSVSRTLAAGRELRVLLLFAHHDLWVAMTAAYPSALAVTLAGP